MRWGDWKEEDDFDQSTLYENLKELIKTLFVMFAKENSHCKYPHFRRFSLRDPNSFWNSGGFAFAF